MFIFSGAHNFVEDILSALKHWSSNDHCKFVEHSCMGQNNVRLLDHDSDKLLLKVLSLIGILVSSYI